MGNLDGAKGAPDDSAVGGDVADPARYPGVLRDVGAVMDADPSYRVLGYGALLAASADELEELRERVVEQDQELAAAREMATRSRLVLAQPAGDDVEEPDEPVVRRRLEAAPLAPPRSSRRAVLEGVNPPEPVR